MNMKKTLAGLVASIVAVSAMATLSASAATIDQKAKTGEWDLTTLSQYKAYWDSQASKTGTTAISTDASSRIVLNFANADLANGDISEVAVTVSGTNANTASANLVQKAMLGNADAYDANTTNAVTDAGKKLTFDLKVTSGTAGDFAGSDVINLKAFDLTQPTTVTVSYKFKSTKSYNSKKAALEATDVLAAGANSKTPLTTAITAVSTDNTGAVAATHVNFIALLANASVSSLDYGKAGKVGGDGLVLKANVPQNLNGRGDTVNGTSNPGLPNIGRLGDAIIDQLAGTQGSTITFSFKPGDDSEEGNLIGYDQWFSDSTTDSFQISLNNRKVFTAAQTLAKKGNDYVDVTFNWDDLIKENSYVGLPGILHSIELMSAKDVTVTKVAYTVPDKAFEDPSKGEGVTETTAAITDAPVASETVADTTAPATNPATGNAPIALAVLPIAIVAAIVIAKKRG